MPRVCVLFSPGLGRKMIRRELTLGPGGLGRALTSGATVSAAALCCSRAQSLSAKVLRAIPADPPRGTGSPRTAHYAPKDPEFAGVRCVIKGVLKIRGFFVLVYHVHGPVGAWSSPAWRGVGWGAFSRLHEASASLTHGYLKHLLRAKLRRAREGDRSTQSRPQSRGVMGPIPAPVGAHPRE